MIRLRTSIAVLCIVAVALAVVWVSVTVSCLPVAGAIAADASPSLTTQVADSAHRTGPLVTLESCRHLARATLR